MKKISIITPVYNEEDNIIPLSHEIHEVIKLIPGYEFEHIYIDNSSTDGTVDKIKEVIKEKAYIGLIVNNRNYGQIRSPFHAMISVDADAVITIAADLQDPPILIKDFISKWEEGIPVVGAVKNKSKENPFMFWGRKAFYKILKKISDKDLIENFSGYALYDKKVINELKKIPDLYPYVRGLIVDLGFKFEPVYFHQDIRRNGKSKNNFITLFDFAMVGIVSNSKVPIRIATLIGLFSSIISLIIGFVYLVLKLINWDSFDAGFTPLILIISFGFSVLIFFTGLIGEYIASIHSNILRRPYVVEEDRFNFPVQSPLNNEDRPNDKIYK